MHTQANAPITRFRGPYGFLSNFFSAEVVLDGERYRSVEHAYQAAHFEDPVLRARFATLETAREAKALAKLFASRPGWDGLRLGVMRGLLDQKFRHAGLRAKLVATGAVRLVEGNTWHDRYWGVCGCATCGEVGENHLGRLLMEVRESLR